MSDHKCTMCGTTTMNFVVGIRGLDYCDVCAHKIEDTNLAKRLTKAAWALSDLAETQGDVREAVNAMIAAAKRLDRHVKP